jgi:hypothetical protein
MDRTASTNSHNKHTRDLIFTELFEARDRRRKRAHFSQAILTATGQPTNGATVKIGSKTYTFQTVLTNVDGNVFIGASLTASLANLLNALNLGAGGGTAYATAMTASPLAFGLSSDATHLTVKARKRGIAGNNVLVATNVTGASWGTPHFVRV